MSRTKREFLCTFCGARPGEPCFTRAGRQTEEHVSRIDAENREWLAEHDVMPLARASGESGSETE